jgi:putative transposase
MSIRQFTFSLDEHYHCYNRGVDKRTIFEDRQDYTYFLKLLRHFNTSEVVGNLRLLENKKQTDPPVTILSYCLLPNHYHLILRCNKDQKGFSKYMQRVGGGYTMYFNQKYKRSGSLFQGVFKAKHIDSDKNLRQLLAYVHHNNIVHDLYDKTLYRNSINTNDSLVRGLASDLDFVKNQLEIVAIIKEMRSTRRDLELE